MSHVIFLFNVLVISLSFTLLVFSIIVYLKSKLKIIKYFIYIISSLSLLNLYHTLEVYYHVSMINSNGLFIIFSRLIGYIAVASIFYTAPLFFNKLLGVPFTKKKKCFFLALVVFTPMEVLIFLLAKNHILSYDIFLYYNNFLLVLLIGLSFYLLWITIMNYKKIKDAYIQSLIKTFLIIIIIFIPFFILDSFLYKLFNLFELIGKNFFSTSIAFFILIIISFKVIIREFHICLEENKVIIERNILRKYQITEREAEVILLVVEGDSNREIAQKLYISEATVKTHLRNVFKKFNVRNRGELTEKLKSLNKLPNFLS